MDEGRTVLIGENLSTSGGNSIFTGENNTFIGGKDLSFGERVTEKRTRTVKTYKPHRSSSANLSSTPEFSKYFFNKYFLFFFKDFHL
jgi:hypothetical protein